MGRFADFLEAGRVRLRLLGVLGVAVAVRLVWIAVVEVDPRGAFHFDMTFYEIAAQRLTEGALLRDFDGTPTAKWSPGYPILLGSLYALFGKSLLVGKVFNAVLAAITGWLTFEIGRRLFRPAVGLLAAAVVALLPGDVFYAALLLSEPAFAAAFTALVLAFVVLFERAPPARAGGWLALGAGVGAALLIRGTAALFLAVPFAILWAARSFGAAFRCTAWASLGLLLVVGPWTLRNLHVMEAPILVSTQQVGMALTFAHSEAADGGYSQRLVRFRDGLVAPFADLPNPEREIAEWRFETRRALAWALENPLRELALIPRRFVQLFAHDHAALAWVTPPSAPGERKPPVFDAGVDRFLAGLADACFYALLALALLGVPATASRRRPAAWILPASVAYVIFVHTLLFAGDPRFHAPLVPILAVLAAAGLLRARVAGPAGRDTLSHRTSTEPLPAEESP